MVDSDVRWVTTRFDNQQSRNKSHSCIYQNWLDSRKPVSRIHFNTGNEIERMIWRETRDFPFQLPKCMNHMLSNLTKRAQCALWASNSIAKLLWRSRLRECGACRVPLFCDSRWSSLIEEKTVSIVRLQIPSKTFHYPTLRCFSAQPIPRFVIDTWPNHRDLGMVVTHRWTSTGVRRRPRKQLPACQYSNYSLFPIHCASKHCYIIMNINA